MFKGCPENSEKTAPHIEPARIHSIVAFLKNIHNFLANKLSFLIKITIRLSVFSPIIPPKATNEHSDTRYMYNVVATHCKLNESAKSLM